MTRHGYAAEIDTIVVPARERGFKEVFLGQHRWYAVRIHASLHSQIKYIAAYRVAPVSAITHIASVGSIDFWKDSEKYIINFINDPKSIGPITLLKDGCVKAPLNVRYTSRKRLELSKTLDDVWRTEL